MVQPEKQTLDFFANFEDFKKQFSQKELFIFLDYDGTLAPIVDTPDQAVISEDMREKVRKLSEYYKVSIVSGRATDDVKSKVQVEGIFYAGSHGFEIVSPDGEIKISEEAQRFRPLIDEVYQKLNERLKGIEGSLVENVKYTISVHYRLVADNDFPQIQQAVEEILKDYPSLRKTSGKKVFELRPKIDWHKGKAVDWILNVLGYDQTKHEAVYIGDDVTDEDAFEALLGKGVGILVAKEPRESKAGYRIKDTAAVKDILDFLVSMKKERLGS